MAALRNHALKYRKRRYSLIGAESTYLLAIDIPLQYVYRTALFADRAEFQRPVYSTVNLDTQCIQWIVQRPCTISIHHTHAIKL